jgi:hypothetical protein
VRVTWWDHPATAAGKSRRGNCASLFVTLRTAPAGREANVLASSIDRTRAYASRRPRLPAQAVATFIVLLVCGLGSIGGRRKKQRLTSVGEPVLLFARTF